MKLCHGRAAVAFAILLVAALPAAFANTQAGAVLARPESLQPAIGFWRRVYTEIDSQQGFLHDDRHLDVVYLTLDLPEGSRAQKRAIRDARNQLAADLRAIATGGTPANERQRKLRALWKGRQQYLGGAADRLRFQRGTADRFRAGMIRSGRWTPHISAALKQHKVPAELVALPHVESSFNPIARSYVGASGMWQFTRDTGRRFMRIDHVVDERLDPFMASDAAARLLRSDYDEIQNWPLAITAYNHGVNGMRRAVRTLGTDDIGEVVQRYRSRTFGFSSRNFYAGFLAAWDVHRDPETYFGSLRIEDPHTPRRVALSGWFGATDLATAAGISVSRLRDLNPALLDSVWSGTKLVPRSFPLRLPPDQIEGFGERLAGLFDHGEQRPDEWHVIRRGEALSTIANRYRVSVRELMALNGISNANRIRAGARLRLPTQGQGRSGAAPATSTSPAVHVVRRGESISRIAGRYGITEGALVAANKISDPSLIQPGQRLQIPTGQSPSRPANHRVRRGESLSRIAARYGLSQNRLMSLNGIRNPDLLQVGTVLRLSQGG